MSETVRLTKRARDAVIRMRAHSLLLCSQRSDAEEAIMRGDGFLYWFEPIGKSCGPSTARELIEKGVVIPQLDGLLEGTTQSWKVI